MLPARSQALPCGHVFCNECVVSWWFKSKRRNEREAREEARCPQCRCESFHLLCSPPTLSRRSLTPPCSPHRQAFHRSEVLALFYSGGGGQGETQATQAQLVPDSPSPGRQPRDEKGAQEELRFRCSGLTTSLRDAEARCAAACAESAARLAQLDRLASTSATELERARERSERALAAERERRTAAEKRCHAAQERLAAAQAGLRLEEAAKSGAMGGDLEREALELLRSTAPEEVVRLLCNAARKKQDQVDKNKEFHVKALQEQAYVAMEARRAMEGAQRLARTAERDLAQARNQLAQATCARYPRAAEQQQQQPSDAKDAPPLQSHASQQQPPRPALASPNLHVVHAGSLSGGVGARGSFMTGPARQWGDGSDGGRFIRQGADGRGGQRKVLVALENAPPPRVAPLPPPQQPQAKKAKRAGGGATGLEHFFGKPC